MGVLLDLVLVSLVASVAVTFGWSRLKARERERFPTVEELTPGRGRYVSSEAFELVDNPEATGLTLARIHIDASTYGSPSDSAPHYLYRLHNGEFRLRLAEGGRSYEHTIYKCCLAGAW